MDDLVSDFVCEAAEGLNGLQSGLARLGVGPDDRAPAEMLRRLHALKGLCGFVGFARAEALCHAGESLVGALAAAPRAQTPAALASLGELTERLGDLLTAAARQGFEPHGEDAALVAALECAAFAARTHTGERAAPPRLAAAVGGKVMDTGGERRTRAPWTGLDTLARALGDRLGKRIDLVVGGDDVRITADAATPLRAALIALVRNACDHGVETPEDRRRVGKPALSLLRLSVHRMAGGGASVEVADDGRGVDPEGVRAACFRAGRFAGPTDLSDGEIQSLIFETGVTTAATVTDLSGRGVGLDLVRREVESLGGEVVLASAPGVGARFLISLPATALATPAARSRKAA